MKNNTGIKEDFRYTIQIKFSPVLNGVFKPVPNLFEHVKTLPYAINLCKSMIDNSVLNAFIIDNVTQKCIVVK